MGWPGTQALLLVRIQLFCEFITLPEKFHEQSAAPYATAVCLLSSKFETAETSCSPSL